VMFFTI